MRRVMPSSCRQSAEEVSSGTSFGTIFRSRNHCLHASDTSESKKHVRLRM